MKRTAIVIALAAATALTACGSDDSTSLSGSQSDAAQAAVDSANEEGLTLDRDCVNDVAAQLSDADAELAASDDDAELSPAGEALRIELISCADPDELIDSLVDAMGEDGTFDKDCARDAMKELDLPALLAASGDEPPAEFVAALTPCFPG